MSALNARISRRASSSDLPFTAALIIDVEAWLIEQPWPAILTSVTVSVSVDLEVEHDLVAAERVEALDLVRGRHRAARRGSAASGSGRG